MRTIDEIKADLKQCDTNPILDRNYYTGELLQAITEGIPIDRLQEICEAEKDGRLVVLPYPIGTEDYFDRLAEFEDIGLSPEEIKEKINNAEVHADCMESKMLAFKAELDRIKAIAENYGVDVDVMLMLAKSQINTARDNERIMEELEQVKVERDALREFAIRANSDYMECDKMFIHIGRLKQQIGYNKYLIETKRSGINPMTFEQYLYGIQGREG